MIEDSDETLRALLLGRLPEAQAQELADRVLLDEAFCLRLQALETDLIDDLARGHLDESDRAAARRMLAATAADRERIRFASALASQATGMSGNVSTPPGIPVRADSRRPRHRRWRLQHALLGAILAGACGFLILVGLPRDGGNLTPTFPITGHEPTIALLAGQQRGPGLASVAISADATSVRLQLEVDSVDALPPFSVRIEQAGQAVFEAHDLAARTLGPYRVVEVVLAADRLQGRLSHVRLASRNAIEQDWPLRIENARRD